MWLMFCFVVAAVAAAAVAFIQSCLSGTGLSIDVPLVTYGLLTAATSIPLVRNNVFCETCLFWDLCICGGGVLSACRLVIIT